MVYVVFLTVLTRLVFHHFMPGNYMFFCFHFNINIVLISSKFVCESNCPFRRPLLTFHLANQLVSFKLANEKAAQSSSATKADMCSGHKLISLGLKKQGWCYCRHSGQDNCISRKTNYYCQLCGADKPLCSTTTSCDCFELHLSEGVLSPKYCKKEREY